MRRLLACLGDASRFRLVARLCAGEAHVSALAGDVGLSQSCTTRHLQALEREGVVRGVRQGKRVVFRLRQEDVRVRELVDWALARSRPPDPNLPNLHEAPGGADAHHDSATPVDPAATGPPPGSARQLKPGDLEDFLL